MSRPEHISPPQFFYDEKEAAKYNSSSRIVKVQEELSNRAIELLNLPEDKEAFILDVGCGSGLSGGASAISQLIILLFSQPNAVFMGMAISRAGRAWPRLGRSRHQRDSSGDVFLQDMGGGLPFRPGVFDGCISISAIQWLCYSDKKEHTARKRLTRFFTSLYTCLKRGSRAVLQLYPETPEQMEEISGTAMRCGFSGGLVIDFPNSAKAKKFYLCLFAGYDAQQQVPQGLGVGATAGQISYEGRAKNQRVSAVKERYRKQGKKVKSDSKFTGRKRAGKF
ncbi:hypothetical protein BBJ28_00015263 [Nothophytophthora sp. Chile5]|nr:hypothetical protein BBJ28_00015263 [Nothophytophthora sp. Chile5]